MSKYLDYLLNATVGHHYACGCGPCCALIGWSKEDEENENENEKEKVKKKTDLNYFLEFCNSISKDSGVEIVREDWDGMYGITVKQNIGDGHQACFNFYEDGKFRAIID